MNAIKQFSTPFNTWTQFMDTYSARKMNKLFAFNLENKFLNNKKTKQKTTFKYYPNKWKWAKQKTNWWTHSCVQSPIKSSWNVGGGDTHTHLPHKILLRARYRRWFQWLLANHLHIPIYIVYGGIHLCNKMYIQIDTNWLVTGQMENPMEWSFASSLFFVCWTYRFLFFFSVTFVNLINNICCGKMYV